MFCILLPLPWQVRSQVRTPVVVSICQRGSAKLSPVTSGAKFTRWVFTFGGGTVPR